MKKIRWIASVFVVFALFASMAQAVPEENSKEAPPELISETAVLMDATTGQVIYNKEMHKQMYPASITKILTTILAVEAGELDRELTISDTAVDAVSRSASHIALTKDEKVTMEELIYAALLVSANDACNGIAEAVSGSMDTFAKFMNEKAAEFGALGTHFTNSNGLKDPEHYTTAYDMAMITKHGLANETWREMFGTWKYDMPANNKQKETRYFVNQHYMISDPQFYYSGIIGGKTGYTTAAKYTLVTAAERNGTELVAVVMNSPKNHDKYKDTEALFDYGFDNFIALQITNEDLPTHTMKVPAKDGGENELKLSLETPISVLVPSGTAREDITITCELKENEPYIKVEFPQDSGQEPYFAPLSYEATPVVAQIPHSGGLHFGWILLIIVGSIIALLALFVLVIYVRKEIYLWRRRRARAKKANNRRS